MNNFKFLGHHVHEYLMYELLISDQVFLNVCLYSDNQVSHPCNSIKVLIYNLFLKLITAVAAVYQDSRSMKKIIG